MAAAHLQKLQLNSSQFENGIFRDTPREYALYNLIAATNKQNCCL
jgi:hypothetical protein